MPRRTSSRVGTGITKPVIVAIHIFHQSLQQETATGSNILRDRMRRAACSRLNPVSTAAHIEATIC
jgi:hypothetical protein